MRTSGRDTPPKDGPAGRGARFKLEIGKLIRARRNELGLTQTALAEQVGISQQQIGKYEKGADRIATDKLLLLCRFLGIDAGGVLYPLAVAEGDTGGFAESAPTPFGVDAFADRDTVALVRAFQSISDKRVRKKVLGLVETMAEVRPEPAGSGPRKRRGDANGSP